MRAICWCCRASSTSTAMRSSASCSRGRASDFAADIALHDTEAQLLANGITTAFHGVTLSWEPGLRSLDGVAGAARCAGGAALDLRHARASALGGVQPRRAGHRAGRHRGRTRASGGVQRPHAVDPEEDCNDPVAGAKYSDRAGMKLDEFRALAERIAARAGEVPAALERIAAAARAAGLPMASHDDAADRHARARSARAVLASANSRWPRRSGRRRARPATGW